MSRIRFAKKRIGELRNDVARAPMNTLCIPGDLNNDGRVDIVVSGRNGRMAWFENKGRGQVWERHPVADIAAQECGGLVYDLDGDGLGDIINGGDYQSDELSWWQNPGSRGGEWTRRVIVKTGAPQFHDELIGDVTGDGTRSLIFWNQGRRSLFRLPLPDDPTISPWPGLDTIATGREEHGVKEEGLAIADLDGDGQNEIVAGTHWYKWTAGGWESHRFARDLITTKVAAGDLDGDGEPEIVLSEGDVSLHDRPEGGKLVYYKRGSDIRSLWQAHTLLDGLKDAHSLILADFVGDGSLDIFVGEIGYPGSYLEEPPRMMILQNDGRGRFAEPQIIDRGTGTHNAFLADIANRGKLDIVGRPLRGEEMWQVHVFYRE